MKHIQQPPGGAQCAAPAPGADMPQERHAPVIAICGAKNSGKTTLIEALLPLLAAQGLQAAVIKHDGHDFAPDVPGTDSHRLAAAGAVGVAVYSAHRHMVIQPHTATVGQLAAGFPGADVVLLEGGKASHWPKIEVLRAAVSNTPVAAAPLLALYSDVWPAPGTTAGAPGGPPQGVPVVPLGQPQQIARLICKALSQGIN